DIALIQEIASALEALDQDADCRAVVLAAQGKAFCAGANFGDGGTLDKERQRPGELNREKAVQHLYLEGNRLFRTKKPIIAAVHGAAVGGGLGLPRARLPSRLRADGDAAASDRRDQGGTDVLHQPARARPRGLRNAARRRAGAAG